MNLKSSVRDTRGEVGTESRDIFISYSHRDKAWVAEYLVPQLQAAGLTFVLDDMDFSIGAKSLDNMRTAVERCHHTLIVLTPDWLRSPWTHYESVIANEKDPSGEARVILPMKLKPCELPTHFGDRSFLDMTDIAQRDSKMEQLLLQLGVSPQNVAQARQSVAKKTLRLLIELMADPSVQQEVSALRETFENIQKQIEAVATYKRIHDYLQSVQQSLGNVSRDARSLAGGEDRWRDAHSSSGVLRQGLMKLEAFVGSASIDPIDVGFILPLKRALQDLMAALRNRDQLKFSYVVEQVSNVVSFSLPQVNDRIIQKLRDKPLQQLVVSLEKIYERVVSFDFDETASSLLDEFRAGIETLEEIGQTICEMVVDHATLQQLESNLNLTSVAGDPSFDRIASGWNYLAPLIAKLKCKDRYERLFEICDQLNTQLNDETVIRNDTLQFDVTMLFSDFVLECDCVFNILDVDLDGICFQVQGHGEELGAIINRMQTYGDG